MELKGIYYRLCTSQTKENKNENDDIVNEIINEEKGEDLSSLSDSESESDTIKETVSIIEDKKSIKSINSDKVVKIKDFLKYEKKLLKFQQNESILIILSCLAQTIHGLMFPVTMIAFSQIYRLFGMTDQSKQKEESIRLMFIIFGLAAIDFLSVFFYAIFSNKSGGALTKNLRYEMFKSILSQEVSYHDNIENSSSILASKLANIPSVCKGLTTDRIGLYFQGLASIGFSIIISLIISWKLTFIIALFVPVIFCVGIFSGKLRYKDGESKTNLDHLNGSKLLFEVVDSMKTIASLTREEYFINKYDMIFSKNHNKTINLFHLQALFYGFSVSIMFFMQSFSFRAGYYLIKNNDLDVNGLFLIYAAITFTTLILGNLYSQIPDQLEAKKSAQTVFKIIDRKSKIDSLSEDGIKIDNVIGKIEFKNVNFEYTTRPGVKILNNFNLSVNNGETNALVGPSGCGKSTTISLLLRFYDPTGGEILLDGVDIKKLNIQWLRSQIGIVSQEPILFNYSIFENISNGDTSREKISIDEIIEAAKQSNIDSRIESLPEVIFM
jgi:ATP-binding cassette, subfamily B (MDR/TAP), member 1